MAESMILPKGIVVNSPEIEGLIERIDREPLAREEIARFWKVYTTTGRRLRDPTAARLENYWWRIWGSRKGRELKGATVARLFAEISDGESFVPLLSPANRDEGPLASRRARRSPVASSSSTTALNSRPSTTSSSSVSKAPTVLPPPILKKSRGPSTGGPRPTARFISPHDSEEESHPISPNSHVVVQPPSPDSQHLKAERIAASGPPASGKKKAPAFVASTAANKKRPVIVRRPSSQTSQSSTESASRAYESAQLLAENESLSQRTSSNPPVSKDQTLEGIESQAHGKGKVLSLKSPENAAPAISALSPKKLHSSVKPASSKRPSPRRAASGTQRQSTGGKPEPTSEVNPVDGPDPSTRLQPVTNGQPPAGTSPGQLKEIEVQNLLLEEASANILKKSRRSSPPTPPKSEIKVLHKSLRSSSDGYQSDIGAIRLFPADVKSTVGLTPVLSPMAGEVATEAPATNLPGTASAARLDKGKGRDPEELERAGMFAKRPVQPISEASTSSRDGGALSKSKSQLTLLLDKDRARSDSVDHKKEEKRRERSKDDKKRYRT